MRFDNEKLKTIRKEKGITQEELAKLIGIQEGQYRTYESGRSEPKLDIIENISSALGLPSAYFLLDHGQYVLISKNKMEVILGEICDKYCVTKTTYIPNEFVPDICDNCPLNDFYKEED